jgi:hypothetical protein
VTEVYGTEVSGPEVWFGFWGRPGVSPVGTPAERQRVRACGRARRVLAPPASTPVRNRAHERLCALLVLSLMQLHVHQRAPSFFNQIGDT